KPHETLIAPGEAYRTIDADWCYIVEPSEAVCDVWEYVPHLGRNLQDGFEYTSSQAARITREELRSLIYG
ncbi:MAG TPA: UDP-N-acetylglucosamine 4,6-dehydratase (inverting), partial [Anaerolineae bacterium]